MNRLTMLFFLIVSTCRLLASCDVQCHSWWNPQTQELETYCETIVCPDDDLPSEPFPGDPADPGPDPSDVPGGDIMDNIAERCLRATHAANLASFEMRPRLGPGQQFNPTNGRWGNSFQGIVDLDSQWSSYINNAWFTVEWTEKPGITRRATRQLGASVNMPTSTVDDNGSFEINITGSGDCYEDSVEFVPYFRKFSLKGFKRFYEKKFHRKTVQTGLADRLVSLTGCPPSEIQRSESYTEQYSIGQGGGAGVSLVELSYQLGFTISRTITLSVKATKPQGETISLWRYPSYDEFRVSSWDYDWQGNKSDIRLEGYLRKDYDEFDTVNDGPCNQ